MDNLKRKVPEDPKKINKNQQWEIEYWAKKLGISEYKLRLLINKVGVYVSDVKKELAKEQISNDINSILGGEREVLRVSFGQFIIQ